MKDITDRKDIDKLVEDFYLKALNDRVIGFIFTEIAALDLEKHLPIIADFWEMILFRTVNFTEKYERSPMLTHVLLNEKIELKAEHFLRWLKLFCETVDEKYAGENAELIKARAFSIADAMRARFSAEKRADVRVVR